MTTVKPFLLAENGAIYGNTKRYFPNVSFEHHLFPVFPEATRIPDEIKANFAMVDEFTDEIIADAETWCEPEYEDVNAMVFYCDSLPDTGSVDTSGDGTSENPFRDLRHALKVIYCYYALFCGKMKFVLNVSGTVDYSVELPNNNFGGCLLIDFEEADPVASSDGNISFWLRGMTIKNLVFKGKRINYPSGGYWTGDNLFLLNCDVEATEDVYASAIYDSSVKAKSINGIFFVKSSAEVDDFGAANVKDCEISAETIRSGSYPIFLDSEISCDHVAYSGGWYDHYAHCTFLHCDLEAKNYCYSFMAKKSTVKASNVASYYCVDCDCKIARTTTALPPYTDLFSSFWCGVCINNNIYSVEKLERWSISESYAYADEILFKNNTVNIKTVSTWADYLLPSVNSFDNNLSYDLYPNSDEAFVDGSGGTPHISAWSEIREKTKIAEYFNNNTLAVRVHGDFYNVEVNPGGPYGEKGQGTYNYNFSCTFTGRLFFKNDRYSLGIDYSRQVLLYGTAPRCNQSPSYSYSLDPRPDVSQEPTGVHDLIRVFQRGYATESTRSDKCIGTFGLAQDTWIYSSYHTGCTTCGDELDASIRTYEGNYTGNKCRYREYGQQLEYVSGICPDGCTEVRDFVNYDYEDELHDCEYID